MRPAQNSEDKDDDLFLWNPLGERKYFYAKRTAYARMINRRKNGTA